VKTVTISSENLSSIPSAGTQVHSSVHISTIFSVSVPVKTIYALVPSIRNSVNSFIQITFTVPQVLWPLNCKTGLNHKLLNVLSKGLVVKYVLKVSLCIIKSVIPWIYLGTLIDGN
jgi:hypothetical protein